MDWAHDIMLINASSAMLTLSSAGLEVSLFQTRPTLFRSQLRTRSFG
jgi:hypothetical protein